MQGSYFKYLLCVY